MPQSDPHARVFELNRRLAYTPWVWWGMYVAAVETIAYRLTGMALGGWKPNARQRRENHRMVAEKWQAANESARVYMPLDMAAGFRALEAWQKAFARWWEWPLTVAEQAADNADAAVRPWQRRVHANAKRLRRRA